MTRPYHRNEPEPTVSFEMVEPESILYQRGHVTATLTGFLASLYKGMVWMYGEDEANERFWWLFHKKNRRRYPARQHRLNPSTMDIVTKEIIP